VLEDGNIIFTLGDNITIGRSWAYGNFEIDMPIDTADLIRDVPCVRIEHIVEYKKIADRPRDREHLAIIEGFQ
jgi:hypothetical protein